MANIKVPLISRNGITSDGGSIRFENTDYMLIPKGTDAQRPPAPSVGMIRNNTTIDGYEAYHKGRWWELAFKTYWNSVVANTTITSGYTSYGVFVGAITSSITITLPLSPKKDDVVIVVDGMKKFAQYPVTIALNGNKFQGTTSNIVLNTAGSGVSLSWSGDSTVGWVASANIVPFDSPNFTGTPTVPTAAADTNTTQIASTAFVVGQAATVVSPMNGTAAVGTSLKYARQDHVHATDTTRAPIASPTFTGTPAAPTAAAGTNTTQLATTAFVSTAISNLVNTAPSTLDTLNELATALGNDPNFATTMTNSLALKAPLASPTLTGTPAAPTAVADTNTTQLATTAFVVGQASSTSPSMDGTATVGTSLKYARADHIHPTDTTRAPVASPTFTGTPAAPTAAASTNSTQLATTAFVKTVSDGRLSKSVAGGVNVTLTADEAANAILDFSGALTANISVIVPAASNSWIVRNGTSGAFTLNVKTAAGTGVPVSQGTITPMWCDGTNVMLGQTDYTSPTFTGSSTVENLTVTGTASLQGTSTAPTVAANTNSTAIATTAFVVGQASSTSPNMSGTAAVGTSLKYARADHTHPSDTSRAPLASPTFTGTPAAPTAALNTNTTQLATTAFVVGQAASTVSPMNGTAAVGTSLQYARQDHVHASDTSRAPLASPTFTGTPAAPTAAAGTNTTQLATTEFVQNEIAMGMPRTTAVDSTTDINTLVTGGWFNKLVGTTNANLPSGGSSYWYILTLAYVTNVTQVAVPYGTTAVPNGPIKYRTLYNGTWSSWVELARTDSPSLTGIPTAPTASVGTNTTQIATTAFVQAEIAADAAPTVHTHTYSQITDTPYKDAVKVASTAALTATYANGTSGVGETLTNSGTLAALVIDGVTMVLNDRVLIKDQASALQNGIYVVTNIGSASVAWVLTRSSDADTSAEVAGCMVTVDQGTVNGGKFYTTIFKATDTIGTTSIPWYEIPVAGTTLAANMAVISDASGRLATSATVSATELSYLDGVTSAIQTQLNAKAPLASPALTGTPTAPTAASGTNTTQIATTAFVQNEAVVWAIVFG